MTRPSPSLGPLLMLIILFIIIVRVAKKKKRKEELQIKEMIEEENRKIEELEIGLPVINSTRLLLGDDTLRYYELATLQVTENKVVGYKTGTRKGITDRISSGRSKAVYRDVISKFEGNLAVTDKRIIFINNQKGFDIKIKDISVIEPYSDGVVIQAKSESYYLVLVFPRYFMELLNAIIKSIECTT